MRVHVIGGSFWKISAIYFSFSKFLEAMTQSGSRAIKQFYQKKKKKKRTTIKVKMKGRLSGDRWERRNWGHSPLPQGRKEKYIHGGEAVAVSP